jgi:hypothetical protein
MSLELNNLFDIFTESNAKNTDEERSNLIGFFDTLITIDQRLKNEVFVKSKNLSNNKTKGPLK